MISQLTPRWPPEAAAAEEESAIEIGHHVECEWNGWTFHLDTIWATVLAGAIVVLLGLPGPPRS